MNPLKRFKSYIIGDALAQTDDVFEKARINLTYNFTVFFLLLGLVFYGNIIANHLWWQFYITTFGVVTLPFILVILKRTRNVTYAGYFYVANQLIMSILNQWLYHFESNIIGGFWVMVFLLFVFFVMGKKWGLAVTAFALLSLVMEPLDSLSGHRLLDYYVPPAQVPEQLPIFVLVPFTLCIYAIYQIVSTRGAAEEQIVVQKKLLETGNRELESKNKDITDSIHYAQKIQYAVLPNEDSIYRNIPLSFILFRPRDIVSGDFFWFHELDEKNYIFVAADCTGHGVPGAFMTVIGSSLLNQIIVEGGITRPSEILLELDRRINVTLKQERDVQSVQDGMDLSLLKVDKEKREFIFTSAKRPALFIRDRQLQEIKGSKFSLGGMRSGEKKFEEIKMSYREDDIIYLFTDGITDQFGGEKGKKYSIKRLRELLMEVHRLPMPEQKQRVEKEMLAWKNNLEQVDDMLLTGIRF